MGNVFSPPSPPPTIATSLHVLGDREATVAMKREAFRHVQVEFAPVINCSAAYSEELRRVHALKYRVWEHPPEGFVQNSKALASVVRGMIFGAAIGDATGLATEFMSREQITEAYPDPNMIFMPGIEVYPDTHRLCFPRGDWTDDTDQLLLILMTLLENEGQFNGPCFASHLSRWKDEGFVGLGDQGGSGLGQNTKQVIQHPSFRDDPIQAADTVWRNGGCKAAPNGALMRTAITGVAFFWDEGIVAANTLAFCRATHADPRCAASCIVVAECVRRLTLGAATEVVDGDCNRKTTERISDIIDSSLGKAEALLKETYAIESLNGDTSTEDPHEVVQELRKHSTATSLEALSLDDGRAIGYTFKCLGAGIWALRQIETSLNASKALLKSAHADSLKQQEPFDENLSEAVAKILHAVTAAGGDADTNAAVAGALLGVAVGYENLPRKWLMALPYAEWMEAWVGKLLFMLRAPTNLRAGS